MRCWRAEAALSAALSAAARANEPTRPRPPEPPGLPAMRRVADGDRGRLPGVVSSCVRAAPGRSAAEAAATVPAPGVTGEALAAAAVTAGAPSTTGMARVASASRWSRWSRPARPASRDRPDGSSTTVGSVAAARTVLEGQGAICEAKSPGVSGPASSFRVSRQRASRSLGTPAAISEGAATPPTTRGAGSTPWTTADSGHRPVSAA